ncbi:MULTISPECIES: prevent-host-death protein [unclassified Variovorax]|uniref:prevent-host-death protein n=1 Tax=unclassified Variovorax TaxID=663243 RepID=UPI001BD693D4|nr:MULTISPECIES: prevent-host-death protein [unclassified Variovorax]
MNPLANLADLPRHNTSMVRNKWGDIVRQVHQSGSVAITNHANVEMVLLDAETYRQVTDALTSLKAREKSVLDELATRFDARLSILQQADAHGKVGALLSSRGRLTQRPQAGASF